MKNLHLRIFVYNLALIILAKVNYAERDDSEIHEMVQKWYKCCRANTCIKNSCYTVEWSYSSWASIRQRCQNMYSDWPENSDLFRIQNEQDIGTFWNMLQKHRKEKPKTIWTGGTICPTNSTSEINAKASWVSTNEEFPIWLQDKISDDLRDPKYKKKGCNFLAISPSPHVKDIKYDFQDQNAHHPAICEFILPYLSFTTESETTSSETTFEVTLSSRTESEERSSTSSSSSHEITSSTSIKTVPSTSMHKTSHITSSSIATQKPVTMMLTTTTTIPMYCKGVTVGGMTWPDTSGGTTAVVKCPKGMIGDAEWDCDEETHEFHAEGPRTEGCKHEWIDNLEDSIRGKHEAVEIADKLAIGTKQNKMSHGDIIALVNLTSNLLTLYTEQKGEEEFENMESEELPVYYNFTKSMISSISNILRTEIKDAWEGLNATRQTKEASTILKLVTTIGSRLSCIKTSEEKLQFTLSAENIDLQTFIMNNTKENDVIVFPQETEKIKASSSIVLPADLKVPRWFSSCKTYNSAVGVIYKHVGDFLKVRQSNTTTEVATKVLSFSLSNETVSIPLPNGKVNITLQHLVKQDIQYQTERNPRCVFWNFSKSVFGEWDESGCQLVDFNETHTLCQCSHLTNFAVLMDINDNVHEDVVLTMMTYVCCGFSSFALFLTLICFLVIRSLHCRRSIITGNLCFSLLITNVLIIFGLDKTQNKTVCAVVAGVLHYCILSAFCWMLVEGYHLYRMVILVFQRGSNPPVKYYYLFSYGTPLIVVGISAAIRSEGYGGDKFCWLSPSNGLRWSFVGPACAIIFVNIIIFVLTLRSASSVKIKREQSTMKKLKSWVRGSISVMCLLGLTWCMGLFYIDKKLYFFSYIFTILNALQGAFIFLFHIILNDKVSGFCSCSSSEKRRHGMRKFLNHTSSNPTNSKTSTRTSVNSVGFTTSTKFTDTRKVSTPNSPIRNYLYNKEYAVQDKMNHNLPNYRKNNLTHAVLTNGSNQEASPL